MKLKRNDHVMVDGKMFYVAKVDPFDMVYIHPEKDPEFGTVFDGPYPKEVYREWAVV